jgi:hypothetical protein
MLATNVTNIFVSIGVVAGIISALLIPAAILFHRKVIRPLRWVLGVSAGDSPTGEAVLPVPQQLLELRRGAAESKANQEKVIALLGPNGGSSILDLARKTHKLAVSTDKALKRHLIDSSEHEREIWQAIAGLSGSNVVGTTTTTHTTQSTVTDDLDDDDDNDDN